MSEKKERLDLEVVNRGFAKSREQAQRLILAGKIIVDEKSFLKPGTKVGEDSEIILLEGSKYVGRGGEKLEGAYKDFDLDFRGKIIADIGSSTGGFTDFALQQGARKVYAIDVGRGQLDLSLRENKKVIVMEKTDIRDIEFLPDAIDFFLVDISFLSIKKILDKIKSLSENQDKKIQIIALIKPQFEVGKAVADKFKGVIKDESIQEKVVRDISYYAKGIGFVVLGESKSKIKGQKGNQEYFLYLQSS